jgi:hypothetical protein
MSVTSWRAITVGRKALLAVALIAASLAGWSSRVAVAGEAPADRIASIVDPGDVRKLYAGKTWLWSDGAGFFAEDGQFRAWSGSGDKASYAVGAWWVDPDGSLCFRASWYTKYGPTGNTTCFGHRLSGNVMYQRRNPSGAWYVFISDPAKPDDEYATLKSGDLIETKYHAAQAQLGTGTP